MTRERGWVEMMMTRETDVKVKRMKYVAKKKKQEERRIITMMMPLLAGILKSWQGIFLCLLYHLCASCVYVLLCFFFLLLYYPLVTCVSLLSPTSYPSPVLHLTPLTLHGKGNRHDVAVNCLCVVVCVGNGHAFLVLCFTDDPSSCVVCFHQSRPQLINTPSTLHSVTACMPLFHRWGFH